MKYILNFLGFILVIIGVVGIFVPLLPTTPFLLLALVFFSKGSDRFHQWLYNHPQLGKTLRDWKEHHSIPFRAQIMASLVFATSAYFVFPNPKIPILGKSAFVLTAILSLSFIWTRATSKPE